MPGVAHRLGLARAVAERVVAVTVLDRARTVHHVCHGPQVVHQVVVCPRCGAFVKQLARVGARVVDRRRRAFALDAEAQCTEHATTVNL